MILALVLVSTYGLTGQIAIYLINSELDRRTSILRGSAAAIPETPAAQRPEVIERTQDFTRRFFPATEILVRDGGEYRYPAVVHDHRSARRMEGRQRHRSEGRATV